MWPEPSTPISIIFLSLVSPNHTDSLHLALEYGTQGRGGRGTSLYPGLTHHARHFAYVISFPLHVRTMRQVLLSFLQTTKLKLKAIRSHSEWCCQDSTLGLSQIPRCLLHRRLGFVSATKMGELSYWHTRRTSLLPFDFVTSLGTITSPLVPPRAWALT